MPRKEKFLLVVPEFAVIKTPQCTTMQCVQVIYDVCIPIEQQYGTCHSNLKFVSNDSPPHPWYLINVFRGAPSILSGHSAVMEGPPWNHLHLQPPSHRTATLPTAASRILLSDSSMRSLLFHYERHAFSCYSYGTYGLEQLRLRHWYVGCRSRPSACRAILYGTSCGSFRASSTATGVSIAALFSFISCFRCGQSSLAHTLACHCDGRPAVTQCPYYRATHPTDRETAAAASVSSASVRSQRCCCPVPSVCRARRASPRRSIPTGLFLSQCQEPCPCQWKRTATLPYASHGGVCVVPAHDSCEAVRYSMLRGR